MEDESISCPWCAGVMEPVTRGRYEANPEDGADAWAACLSCLSCASTGPWGKGDTKDDAIASSKYRARGLLRQMAARFAEGGA